MTDCDHRSDSFEEPTNVAAACCVVSIESPSIPSGIRRQRPAGGTAHEAAADRGAAGRNRRHLQSQAATHTAAQDRIQRGADRGDFLR